MKSSTLSNFIWNFSERISAQIISFIVSIILARLLDPSDYGLIAIVMIFITLANVFVSDGLGTALIQKKEATSLDFFSVAYFNLVFSLLLYVVLYLFAPYISTFYDDKYKILTPVLRVLGICIFFKAINSVQNAYVSKKMMFRKFFVATLWGTFLSAVVGIVMAYAGLGVWALVGQQVVNTVVNTCALFVMIKKRPRLQFSFNSVKELLPFGIRILSTGLIITGYAELQALLIGKIYSPTDLAYYDKGKSFPNLVIANANTSIGAVLFPQMANNQDDKMRVKEITRKSIRFSSYVMFPLMLGLAAVSESLVQILLTEKWSGCVPLLQLFCIMYLFFPVHTANMQAIKALGRSDITLRTEIIKKSVELCVLMCTIRFGVKAIVAGMALCATTFIFVNAYPNVKLLGYNIKEQLFDILPNLTTALIMFVIVNFVGKVTAEHYTRIFIQIITGVIVYAILSVITKNKEFEYIKTKIISFFKRN